MRTKTLSLQNGRVTQGFFENFSFAQVATGESVLIPEFQQMLLVDELIVEGELQVDGLIVMDEFQEPITLPKENFSFKEIEASKTILVESAQQMLVITEPFFEVEGEIQIDGMVILDEIEDQEIPPSVIPADNFSWKAIPSLQNVSVPANQQMVVDGMVEVEGGLVLEGELSVIDDELPDGLTPYFVESGDFFIIPTKKQMFLVDPFILDGELINEGVLALGA